MNERLLSRLIEIPQVEQGESAFRDAVALWVNGKEIAHFDSDSVLDVRLTRVGIRDRRAELRADPRVHLRASGSDWLSVTVSGPQDEDFAVDLVTEAAAAHAAPPGAIAAPPPEGADLARRRRFH